jgi:hypothetical protein
MKRTRDSRFEQWARRATRGQKESTVFLSLWSEKMFRDPLDEPHIPMQLGLAMLLDKPIIVVAPEGAYIPVNVLRAARAVKYFNPDDEDSLHEATQAALREVDALPPM